MTMSNCSYPLAKILYIPQHGESSLRPTQTIGIVHAGCCRAGSTTLLVDERHYQMVEVEMPQAIRPNCQFEPLLCPRHIADLIVPHQPRIVAYRIKMLLSVKILDKCIDGGQVSKAACHGCQFECIVLATTASLLSLAMLVSILSMAALALSIVCCGVLWKGGHIIMTATQTDK